VIAPYDRVLQSDGCTRLLNTLVHNVTIRFESLGTKPLRIQGWDGKREPIEITRPVIIEGGLSVRISDVCPCVVGRRTRHARNQLNQRRRELVRRLLSAVLPCG